MTTERRRDDSRKKDRLSYVLYCYYLILLFFGLLFGGTFLCIKIFWKPDQEIASRLTRSVHKEKIEPKRGNILSHDGRPLAMSYPRYQLHIDCAVRKEEFGKLPAAERKDSIRAWKAKAAELSIGLSKVFGKSEEHYRKLLCEGFDKGRRYIELGKPIEKEQYEFLKSFPLVKEGRFKGGVLVKEVPTRRYPFGPLARKTIGSVVENDNISSYSGIDGKYNYALRGKAGHYYVKETDLGDTRDYDSTYVAAVDGSDIRTTLNIDYQDIADRILREYVEQEEDLEEACFVLMDVKSGAIRTMVNLRRGGKNLDGEFGEIINVAVSHLGEPGSVFKITTLMTCVEDGIVNSIDDTVPGKDGLVQVDGYKRLYPSDKHLKDYTREFHTTDIPLWFCVQVSSNNAFRYLAVENFKDKPEDFISRLHSYNLGKSFDFDVFENIATPTIKHPNDRSWSRTDLGQMAMGYSVSVTPMHLLTFYNAIAAGGKMMKPYLVESIEKDGKTIEELGPAVLNSSICSKQTADIITQALCKVTEMGTDAGKGTAWRLSFLPDKCKVAGKTGTSDVFTDGRYVQSDGARKQQGTFVGFFPADKPQYSVICCVYSKLSHKEFAGGVIPCSVVRDFIKEIYNIDPYWNESI